MRPVEAVSERDRDIPSPLDLSTSAVSVLIEEAELTPKPALVDRRSNGAHHDLDLGRLQRSAEALQDGFADIARAALGEMSSLRLREQLGRIGRDMERRMLAQLPRFFDRSLVSCGVRGAFSDYLPVASA